MSSENRNEAKLGLQDVTVDGRPVTQRRSDDLNTMTLDERDNGLYRDMLHAERDTSDLLKASFGEAWLAERLTSPSARRLRFWTWILLVIPFALLGCMGTLMAWDDVEMGKSGYLKAVSLALLWWSPTVYWLYAMYRRPPAGRS